MKLKKIRKALLVVLTLALVSATAVAVTWAFTEAKLTGKDNEFHNEDISAELTEWEWDGKPSSVDSDPSHTITSGTPTLGEELAKSYSPEMTIPKNPSISNISDTSATGTEPTEWVAMTVRYYLIDGEDKYYFSGYTDFAKAIATVRSDKNAGGFNTTDWAPKDDSDNTVFYYKTLLNNKAMTATIFDDVVINNSTNLDAFKTVTGDNVAYVYGTNSNTAINCPLTKIAANGTVTKNATFTNAKTYPEFHIELKGYAVQGNAFTAYTAAASELNKLIAEDPITQKLA